jgi:hemolysin activation/secretion protein
MGNQYSIYLRCNLSFARINFLLIFSMMAMSLIFNDLLAANPRTPSQALPKMFQRPAGVDYYEMKKQDQIIPAIPEIKLKQQEDTGITITPETLIILAPTELQKVVPIDKYQEKIIGKELSISELYNLALEVEKDFNDKGYPLVRVILPTQELEPEQATVFLKVIDGYIEQLNLSKVPVMQVRRIYSYLKPLIKKKAIKLENIERQLLLAGNIAGLSLTSTLLAGINEGGTVLAIESKHKLVGGSMTFDNTQSEELGRQQGQIRAVINSPMGLGETISMFGLARPTMKGMKGTGTSVPIRAGGVAMSVPIGNDGVTAGLSYMESMTRPGGNVQDLGLEANMKSGTATISYPLVYKRDRAVFFRSSLSWTDEVQHTNIGGTDDDLSHDRVTVLRFGTSLNRCKVGCIGIDLEYSRGIDIASRSLGDVGSGTPLSRASGKNNFSHFKLDTNYAVNPTEDIQFKIHTGGQLSLDDLLNSEQSGITGYNKLSGFTSGSISGDESWYVRAQLNKNYKPNKNLSVSPYVYGAAGVAYTLTPTAAENRATAAKSIGLGLQIDGMDKYFFDKSISAKAEYSKNWATGVLEDVSDVRLNKQHLLVSLAMTF